MKVFEYIILSFVLSLPLLLTISECADKVRLRLTRGLLVSLIIALEQVLVLALGMVIGNLLRFEMPEFDNLVSLGLLLVVAIRMFVAAFRKPQKQSDTPVFDISRWSTVLLLGIAAATNTFFVGIALGFRTLLEVDLPFVAIPLGVVAFLFSYWGIMLGRQHKEIRRRRWLLIATLFLLVYAIKNVVDA